MSTADDLFDIDVDVPDREQWLAEVGSAVKGRPYRSLVTTLPDGIDVAPLYTGADSPDPSAAGLPGAAPFVRGATATGALVAGFDLRQGHVLDDPAVTNAEILDDLEGGATSISLRLLRPPTVDDLDDALAGVLLDLAPVALEPGPWFAEAGRALADLLGRRGLDPAVTTGALGADPVGALARHGALSADLDDSIAALAALADVAGEWPGVSVAVADGSVWADAGATPATEVALTLATAAAYLRALESAGVEPGRAGRLIAVTLTADVDQFTTIAKLRSARYCWARMLTASGVPTADIEPVVGAVTAAAMVTRVDPWVNLLRTTVATFAAMAGGATSVTVRPFDAAIGRPSELGRRLARNIAHLLSEESGLTHVVDPAGGSWYVESLTTELAAAAWERLGEIDSSGGVAAALTSGRVAALLDEQWQSTLATLATRRRPLTGVSEFPLVDEEQLEREPFAVAEVPSGGATVDPLAVHRLAEPFEALRVASDHHLDSTGARPSVFLANLGPLAEHTTRSTFATNTFGVAGIATIDAGGHDDDASLVAAWRASGTAGAVICSSDDVYAQRAQSAASALHEAGCAAIWLAGKPGDDAAALREAGVVGFVHLGVDLLAVLGDALDRLGVQR
ncbi:MAG: methylmalonyl-CoA mutase family protein [Acidimicrobiales bacterium]